jgi:glycosyltransferase involved in cell wall biosynthesis
MILFRGPYKQRDGWGRASEDFARCLLKTSHEVNFQPLVLSNMLKDKIHPELEEHVNLDKKPKYVIQHSLPSFMDNIDNVVNIGLCATETNNLQKTGWVDRLNELSQVWCWTPNEKTHLKNSGVSKPINVIPQPMDLSFFDNEDKYDDKMLEENFIFYFIGELNQRKNIDDTILAYWRELKLSASLSPDMLGKAIYDHLENLKRIFRLYNKSHYYPEVLIISEYLSDIDIVKLHNSGNCFITTSHGEATCIPLLNALYKNNHVICTEGIGADDPDFNMLRAKATDVPCVCPQPPLPYLYSSWETWKKVDVIDVQKQMRNAFNGATVKPNKEIVREKHSYESVAKRVDNLLC